MLLWAWSPTPDETSLLVTPQTESNERGKRSGLPTSRKTGWPGRTVQHELGCAERWQGCVVGSFPLTRWLPRKYRPGELSTQEKPRQMGKEGYTINT